MPPNPMSPVAHILAPGLMTKRLVGGLSFFTLVMTVPQAWTIWVGRQAAGVSLLSWGAYLISAVLWFWYGLQKRDKNIYLPCIGWMLLDIAVITGVLLNR